MLFKGWSAATTLGKMSAARCSSCHCYSRNCPDGLPNHKQSSAVGPSCTMNQQGRHYRDQADVTTPMCDYGKSGQMCDFFTSAHEFSTLAYPEDVTLGPILPDTSGNDQMSQILDMLMQQKLDSQRQFADLQSQITTLNSAHSTSPYYPTPGPSTTTPSPAVPTTRSQQSLLPTSNPVTFSTTVTAPHVVSSAAAALSSHLQTGLGHQHNLGYQALTMDQLRSDQAVVAQANRLLASSTSSVPPLNPMFGLGGTQNLGLGSNQVTSVDELFAATTVNKQLRAYEFAATGQFSYKSQLKQDNTNAVSFAFGSFKHLEAAKQGLIKMSDVEFLARLRHLKNVFEVACLSSNLSSFTDPAWQIAREYDTRVIADIESGAKSWESLSNGLETDSIYCAKETVEMRNKQIKKPKDPKDPKKTKDGKSKPCTTYNSHRSSDGCFWEHQNKGEVCVFEHFCSWCKENRDVKEKHKAIQCDKKPE